MTMRTLFIGTYTPTSAGQGRGEGIYATELDTATGGLSYGTRGKGHNAPHVLAELPGASFLATDELRTVLVSAYECLPGGVTGFFRDPIDPESPYLRPITGNLVTSTAPSGGDGPCHVLMLDDGRHVVATNYGSGHVCVVEIDRAAKSVELKSVVQHAGSGPDADRQASAHPHSSFIAPDGSTVLVADLGTDRLHGYTVADDGTLDGGYVAAALAPGAGPRHAAVHASGHIYVACELDATVAILEWEPAFRMARQVGVVPAASSAAAGDARVYPAHIVLNAKGDRLYLSNRGSDTISTFSVSADGASLELIGETATGGVWPRHFALIEDAALPVIVVGNERSDNLVSLPVDPSTGIPAPAASILALPSPAFVLPG